MPGTRVLTNLAGQSSGAVLALVALPVFVEVLGAEAFGLVGFAMVVQAWLALLESAGSPALVREAARLRARTVDVGQFHALLRATELTVLAFAALFVVAAASGSEWLAESWLKSGVLPIATVAQAIALLSAASAARVVAAVYKGAAIGLDLHVAANAVTVTANVGRFLGVLPLLQQHPDVRLLFAAWTGIALAEAAVLRLLVAKAVPRPPEARGALPGGLRELVAHLRFSGSLALASVIWMALSQVDRAILSGILALDDFGRFMLAVTLANGITLVSAALVQAFTPALVRATSTGDRADLAGQFLSGSRTMAAFAWPLAATLAALPGTVFMAWTGDTAIAGQSGAYLPGYALGAGLVAGATMLYALQVAAGNVRLQIVATLLWSLGLVPAVYLVATMHGPEQVPMLWLASCSLSTAILLPLVLRRFLPEVTVRHYLVHVVPVALAAAAPALLARQWAGDLPNTRLEALVRVIVAALAGGTFALLLARRGTAFLRTRTS